VSGQMQKIFLLSLFSLSFAYLNECYQIFEERNPLNPSDIKKMVINLNNIQISDKSYDVNDKKMLSLKGKFTFNICKPVSTRCTTNPASIFEGTNFCFEPGKINEVKMTEYYAGVILSYSSPEKYQGKDVSTLIYLTCERQTEEVIFNKFQTKIDSNRILFQVEATTKHACRFPYVPSLWENFWNGTVQIVGFILICGCLCFCCFCGGGGSYAVKRYRIRHLVVYEEL
jgi:hypothetical protein